MTNLINPKPRFGYNPSTETIYDYQAQRDVALTDRYQAPDGTWDLHEAKRRILAGETVEGARVPGNDPAPVNAVQGESNLQPNNEGKASNEGATEEVGLTAEQLQAAKLSDLQAVALGISAEQVATGGASVAQVAAWKLTPSRIKALKLTPEQVKILTGGG